MRKMSFIFINRRFVIGRRQLLLGFGGLVAWLTLASSDFDPIVSLLLLGIIYLVLRITTKPLSRFIAHLRYSIRSKLEVGIAAIAVLFLVLSLIQIGAMNFMHDSLHDIQDLMAEAQGLGTSPPINDQVLTEAREQVLPAINDLEDTHHGPLYRLLPFLGVIGVLGAAAIGGAMAWSVIDPVRRMEQALDRIASGDFSQPVQVENRDEVGDLAGRLNETAQDLARLQEATLAEERTRSLQERIARVTLAQEEERRRKSRELHDGLGPSLAAVGNQLRACQLMVRSEPERAERQLKEIATSLKGNVQEIRELIHGLRPLTLDQLGLVSALGQHVQQFGERTGIQAALDASVDVSLDPLSEITVFRIIQEGLNNVQNHADASEVDVSLQMTDTGLQARVRDNGRGFPDEVSVGAEGKGMGILSMRERAELLGGSLSIQSFPDGGCEILLFIPLTEVAVGAHPSSTSG